MKNLLTFFCLSFSITNYQAQILDETIDSSIVRPPVTKFKINIDSCRCKKERSYVNEIIDTLKQVGRVYDLKTDDWYYEDSFMFNTFNKAYNTKVFSDIRCSKNIYYSSFYDKQTEDWIQIKEWVFNDNQNANKAFTYINKKEFNSDYFGPRNWSCILKNNKIYFLCGASIDFWDTNKLFLTNIINRVLLKYD